MVLLAVVGTQEEVVTTGSDTFSLFAVLVYSASVVVASRRLFIWPVQCTPCSVSWTVQKRLHFLYAHVLSQVHDDVSCASILPERFTACLKKPV